MLDQLNDRLRELDETSFEPSAILTDAHVNCQSQDFRKPEIKLKVDGKSIKKDELEAKPTRTTSGRGTRDDVESGHPSSATKNEASVVCKKAHTLAHTQLVESS